MTPQRATVTVKDGKRTVVKSVVIEEHDEISLPPVRLPRLPVARRVARTPRRQAKVHRHPVMRWSLVGTVVIGSIGALTSAFMLILLGALFISFVM